MLSESRIGAFCACCDAFASAFASSSRSLGERVCSWEARSRTAWAPLAGLLLMACAAPRPAAVPLSAFARFWALLFSAGVPGSVSRCSCCSAGVIDSSALRGLAASRIFAWVSCRIFSTWGLGLSLAATFFCASVTTFAARAWLARSACRWASTRSIGLGSKASPSAKMVSTATSDASPRLTRTGKALTSEAPAACRRASCRSAPSMGPASARRSQAVDRRSLRPSRMSASAISRGALGRRRLQASTTSAAATGTPMAATSARRSKGTSRAITSTAAIQAPAATRPWTA